jgi:16S rRNA (uracil1498-N3)-methyltransferase
MHYIFSEIVNEPNFVLSENESKHCNLVLRMKVGDIVKILDGKGVIYTASISKTEKRKTEVLIVDKCLCKKDRKYSLSIAIAPTKNNDRFEWFIEKAVEIGIDRIYPILCANSERKIVKVDRLEKVIVAAVKQSISPYKPELIPLQKVEDVFTLKSYDKKYIAHCHDEEKQDLTEIAEINEKCLVLIGPEGDFNESEIIQAKKNGFIAVSLGEKRLRTETAGVYACSIFSIKTQFLKNS